jgi:prepilin-type N-terminal cleavage/methylation domain-containing protein
VKQLKREGYSLVELMIATAISVIVLAGLITLLAYGVHSMSMTQTRVALQNEAKDAINHISAYVMEACDVEWNEPSGDLSVLTVVKELSETDAVTGERKKEYDYYWAAKDAEDNGSIYFQKSESPVASGDLSTDKKHLLLEHVQSFSCEKKENSDTGKQVVHVEIGMADEDAEFACKKDIYMRNQ